MGLKTGRIARVTGLLYPWPSRKMPADLHMEVRTLTTPINTLSLDNEVRPFKHKAPAARRRPPASSAQDILPVLPRHTLYLTCKAVLDRVVAAALLITAAPVIALLAGLVKLTSRGP